MNLSLSWPGVKGQAPSIHMAGSWWAAAGSTEAFLPPEEACFLGPVLPLASLEAH